MTRRILFCFILAAGLATTLGVTATTGLAQQRQRAPTPPLPPPSSFSTRIDNQWFPLRPGTHYVYTGVKDRKAARDVVVVTHETKTIEGVPCVAVADRLYLRGRLEERTT